MKTIEQINGRNPGDIGIGSNPHRPDSWHLVIQQEHGFLTTICFDPYKNNFYPAEVLDEHFLIPLEVPEHIMTAFKEHAIAQSKQWQEIANKLGS